jgi:hypothetical protein
MAPSAPIEARLQADGPLRALAVQGSARLEAAALSWRGRVDAPARKGQLQLTAHAVQPARLWSSAPAMTVSGRFALAGRVGRGGFSGSVGVDDGDVVAGENRVSGVAGDAQLRLAREGQASISRLAGRWKKRPVAVRGTVVWTRRQVTFDGVDLDVDGTRGHAALGRYERDDKRLSLRADPVTLSPALLTHLLHRPVPRAWTGRLAVDGTRGDLQVTLAGPTRLGAMQGWAHVVGGGGGIDLPRVEVQLADSRLVGAVRYRAGRIDASVEDLALAPALVTQLVPAVQPTWPIHVRGAVTGRLQSFGVMLTVVAGPTVARLRGRVAARQFRLAGQVDNFDLAMLRPKDKHLRATLQVAADGRFDQGGVVGTLNIHGARGYAFDSPFYRGWADVRLEGRGFTLNRAVAEIPGARLIGDGSGAVGKGVDIDFGVVITNPWALRKVPQGMRVLIGIDTILPGRTVSGKIIKRPGQKVEVKRHVLPIGVAQLSFLLRVITGRLPRFETRL